MVIKPHALSGLVVFAEPALSLPIKARLLSEPERVLAFAGEETQSFAVELTRLEGMDELVVTQAGFELQGVEVAGPFVDHLRGQLAAAGLFPVQQH